VSQIYQINANISIKNFMINNYLFPQKYHWHFEGKLVNSTDALSTCRCG